MQTKGYKGISHILIDVSRAQSEPGPPMRRVASICAEKASGNACIGAKRRVYVNRSRKAFEGLSLTLSDCPCS